MFISSNCFNSQLLQAAGWCWNILRENFPQKNLSGFLSPPDAITFLCGEFSKHIWTQRQENTIGSYKQILIKTHKYRNCLAFSLSPSLSFGRNLAKTSRPWSEAVWKIGEIEKGRKLKNGQTAEDGRSKWAALCTTSSSHPLDTFSTVWHWTQVYWNKQPTWKNFSFNFRMHCLLLGYKFICPLFLLHCFHGTSLSRMHICEKGGKHIIFLFENSPRVVPSIFQQENICRWTPREISSFDSKF